MKGSVNYAESVAARSYEGNWVIYFCKWLFVIFQATGSNVDEKQILHFPTYNKSAADNFETLSKNYGKYL